MEKYICECCGGSINPETMKCEFCGTYYKGNSKKKAVYLQQLLNAGIPVNAALELIEREKGGE